MGYRVRLGRIPKTERNKCLGMSEDQVIEYFNKTDNVFYRPPNHVELVELGMYKEFDPDNCEHYYGFLDEDHDFFICNRQFLVDLIEDMRKSVHSYYTEILNDIECDDYTRAWSEIRRKCSDWDDKYVSIFKLDPADNSSHKDGELTRSYSLEYHVFNLVHILHTFDWENDYLIYSGW